MARRSRRWTSVITVAVFAVLVAAVGFVLSGRNDGSGGGSGNAGGPSFAAAIVPTGSTASPVAVEQIIVTASSALADDDDLTYGAANTIDGDLTTAWNSDVPDGEVVGQSLVYRFVEPVDLRSIRFVNGYAKSDAVFSANHRIHRVEVTTDSGVRMLTLLDTADAQEITHDFGLTSKVSLEVVEVYEGSGFTDESLTSDLALTEISFVAVQADVG